MNKEKQDEFVAWLDERADNAEKMLSVFETDHCKAVAKGHVWAFLATKSKLISLTKEQDNE